MVTVPQCWSWTNLDAGIRRGTHEMCCMAIGKSVLNPPNLSKHPCLHIGLSIAPLPTLFRLAPLPDEHHPVSCSTTRHSSTALNSCTTPPTFSPLSLGCLLLEKMKDDWIEMWAGWWGCRRGAWAQCYQRVAEVEQETRHRVLVVGWWWVSLIERVGRWSHKMDQRASLGI